MPTDVGAVATAPLLRFDYHALVRAAVAVAVFCGAIALVEPSPYDFASVIGFTLWALGGFRLNATALLFAALIAVYNFGGFVSLMPHLDEELPTLFMLQSLYLAITAVFFALYFSEDTTRRGELCLTAFAASTVVAATCGILGYFDVGGLGAIFSMYDRASGTFKDPNVLGSYLILGALTYMQRLMLGRTRRPMLTLLALLIVTAGVFLSFSRGSWLAYAIAAATMLALTFATVPDGRARRRILLLVGLGGLLGVIAIGGLLADSHVRAFFFERAALTQEYDVGETGRFGNQLRSLNMLLDRVNGFGPLRFRLIFELDPHNSYINAFASYGWLGACAFFLLVGLTFFIGFRLAVSPSPYRRLAQVFWPALMVFLLQALQIDIDHWRHVYLMFGAVWGLEAARQRWLRRAGVPQAARTWARTGASRVPVAAR